ncbi:MAG: DUF4136 domain-containing protein [Burkholderiaceae bacterium]|nr:MAG: DUF4136 domain-containing protein [Burkholderiaceae bacterium]
MKSVLRSLSIILISLVSASLVGCASTYTSHVVKVNQLPDNLPQKSYQFKLSPEQEQAPEVQHATEEIRTRLQELGFEEAKDKANLYVSLRLSSKNGDVEILSPFGPVHYLATPYGTLIPISGALFYPPRTALWRAPGRRPLMYWYDPFYSPFYFGRFGSPYYSPYAVKQYYKHELAIDILDAASGKPLYQVTARSDRSEPEMDEQISYLVESALRDFPGKTGKEWVKLTIEK